MTERVLWFSVRSGQDILSGSAPSCPNMVTSGDDNSRNAKLEASKTGVNKPVMTSCWIDSHFFLLVVVKSLQAFSLTREFHQIVLAASDPEVITMISFGRWNVFIITRPNISQKEQTSGEAWLSD